MKKRKNKTIIVIVIMAMLVLVCFGIFNSSANNMFKEMWLSLASKTPTVIDNPHGSTPQQPEEPELPDKEPVEEPEIPDPVPELPDSEIESPETDPPILGQNSTTPVIYVNQQLVIPVASSNSTVQSQIIYSGTNSSSSKQIALTFDAGWLFDQTLKLLEVLDDYNVKSTFFLRGQWVKDNPALAKEILARGHSVENHSLTHGHMKEMTDSEILNEMATSTSIIKQVTGYKPYLFRPPFGEYDSRILKILAEHGYTHTVMWTIDSHDWAENLHGVYITEQYLIHRILGNASNNGIVLMHIGGYQTVNALPEIIEGLRKDGYKIVKVNDMLPEPSSSNDSIIYTVKQGDTLTNIAKIYGITVNDIINTNQLGNSDGVQTT